MTVEAVDRRDFLRLTGLAAGSLVLGCRTSGDDDAGDPAVVFSPDIFVSLTGAGAVTIVASRSEMGQGIRTALPSVLADEMGADWSRVEVVQAKGDSAYGDQNTDGSRSARRFFEPMRRTGAVLRQMLETAAAEAWGVDVADCAGRDHAVEHRPSGRTLGFGTLAAAASELPVPDASTVELKSPEELRYIGGELPIVDLDDLVRGRAIFGIDAATPEMLHASIERPPVLGSTVAGYDEAAALAVPGVHSVVPMPAPQSPPRFHPLGGVAVLADTTWAALEGRRALAVEWRPSEHASYDSASFRRQLATTARRPGTVVRQRGDVDAALRTAPRTVEADYHTPHLAQAPMEPPAALASFGDGRCDVWAATQAPQSARREIARALEIDESDVHVNVTLLGGGFGRKSKPDYVVEAALLSKAAGRPVKVTWSREDDIRLGYLHSVSGQHLEAALDEEGRTTAWLHRTVFPPIGSTFDAEADRGGAGELGQGVLDLPFDVPNLRCEVGPADAHVRIGWLRSVANIYHAFAIQSFADELAHAARVDPKEHLLRLLGEPRHVDPATDGADYRNYGDPLERYPIDTGRLRRVVELAAGEAGWGRDLPPGSGMGIAAHRSFLSYVAVVIVAQVDEDSIRVEEAYSAIDCGTVLHADRVHAQLEGALVFGLSLALSSAITAVDGVVEQSNFHDYTVLRMSEMPRRVETSIVPSSAPPGGVGEPGVPPVAPALANAVFAASGRRLRSLPLLDALRA